MDLEKSLRPRSSVFFSFAVANTEQSSNGEGYATAVTSSYASPLFISSRVNDVVMREKNRMRRILFNTDRNPSCTCMALCPCSLKEFRNKHARVELIATVYLFPCTTFFPWFCSSASAQATTITTNTTTAAVVVVVIVFWSWCQFPFRATLH